MIVSPVNLYNVDYFFEKVTWIDVKDLREDSGEADRVTIEELKGRHREAL
jgi:hypothetical protein